jgi:predicted nuclease of restriction endonuclease-like (RecB) superfamily
MPRTPVRRSSRTTLPTTYGTFLADLKSRIRTAQTQAALAVNRELIALYWHIGKSIVERQVNEGWGKAIIERLSRDVQTEFPGIGGFSRQNIQYMRGFYLAWSDSGAICQQAVGILAHHASATVPPQLSEPTGTRSATAKPQQAVGELANVPQAVGQIRQQPAGELAKQVTQGASGTKLAQPVPVLDGQDLPHAVAELPWGHNILLISKLKDPPTRLWYAHQTTLHGWSRNILALSALLRNGHRRAQTYTE